MMLGLGIVLLLNPAFLNNILVSFGILLGALTLSGAIATITRKIG
jgi:hypothetical protein